MASLMMRSLPLRNPAQIHRIRIKTPADLERLYPLIEDFIQHPDHADSVQELIFRYGIKRERYFRKTDRPEELKAAEAARQLPDTSSPLWEVVHWIGLSTESDKAQWVKQLSWMSLSVLDARKQALGELEFPHQVMPWVRHQNSLFAQYAAAALLVLCPNIETLVYEDNDSRPGAPVYDVLRRNNQGKLPEPGLTKLKHVRFLPTDHPTFGDKRFYVGMDVLRLLGLFHRAPSLDGVTANAVSPHHKSDFEHKFPPTSSAIKKINLTHVSLPSTLIASLIRASRRLEEFTCTSGGRANEDNGSWLVFPETVGRALWCQRGSLKKLDLDWDQHLLMPYERGIEWDEDEEGFCRDREGGQDNPEPEWEMVDSVHTADLETGRTYDSTIGSLHDFDQLTHLSIGIKWLIGTKMNRDELQHAPFRLIDALPRSLEYLLIRGYRRGEEIQYDNQIDELLALKKSSLPNLKTIEGVEELAPSGEDVESPDQKPHLLWEPEEIEDEW